MNFRPVECGWLKEGSCVFLESEPTKEVVDKGFEWLEGIPAAAATQVLNAFRVSAAVLVDTGCGYDLISAWRLTRHSNHICCLPKQIFNTANGPKDASRGVVARIDAICDDDCEFYLMKDTPTIISIGKRCAERGDAFIWLPGLIPVLVTPDL